MFSEDGGSIVGAQVMLDAADHEDGVWVPSDFQTTDDKGRFEFVGVPGTRIKLEISADGYRSGEEVFTPGIGELEVRLAKQDANVQRRIEEIDAELQELYGQIGTAKDDASRSALVKKLQALNAEKAKLEGG